MASAANHAGRVGSMAFALALGAAVATSPGIAWADGTGTGSTSGQIPTSSESTSGTGGAQSTKKPKKAKTPKPARATKTADDTAGPRITEGAVSSKDTAERPRATTPKTPKAKGDGRSENVGADQQTPTPAGRSRRPRRHHSYLFRSRPVRHPSETDARSHASEPAGKTKPARGSNDVATTGTKTRTVASPVPSVRMNTVTATSRMEASTHSGREPWRHRLRSDRRAVDSHRSDRVEHRSGDEHGGAAEGQPHRHAGAAGGDRRHERTRSRAEGDCRPDESHPDAGTLGRAGVGAARVRASIGAEHRRRRRADQRLRRGCHGAVGRRSVGRSDQPPDDHHGMVDGTTLPRITRSRTSALAAPISGSCGTTESPMIQRRAVTSIRC